MPQSSRLTLPWFALSALLWVTGFRSHALEANLPPGGNFDLSHWYLGLPVDSSGGTSGDSASVPAAQLVAGYSNALYFYTGADGAMTFWAPVTGATTPGSSYPRSELREQISPPSNDVNWNGYGTSILDAQCRVLEVPSTKKVIIGQIHTKTGAARPLVKLQYNDGVVEGLVKNSPDADPDTKFTFQNVGLGNLVNYTLRMENGLVTMTVNGFSQAMNVFQSDTNWANQEFYFKAGSYCQDNVGTPAEGARVAFYTLAAAHGATNTPPGPTPTVTNLIVDDMFLDGDRTRTGALDADWWSSSSASGNSIEVYPGQLGLVSGTSGRGIHGTFAPQTLAIGETLLATYTFTTPATVGGNKSASFKIALVDLNDPGLAADLSSSSGSVNPLYTNLPGYMVDLDVNTGATANTSFREHMENTVGRFLGTTTEWNQISTGPDDGYGFVANTEYVGVFSITRTGTESIELFSSLSQGGSPLTSHRMGHASSPIANHFGMLGFWANSGTFGSTTTHGALQDNGITFSNVRIEVVTSVAPTLNITLSGADAVLSWATDGSGGFQLETATNMSPAGWSEEGPPTVISDRNYVTNSITGGMRFYRLKKP